MELVDVLEIEADREGKASLLREHELEIEAAPGLTIDVADEI
jgi:hypothetical protein